MPPPHLQSAYKILHHISKLKSNYIYEEFTQDPTWTWLTHTRPRPVLGSMKIFKYCLHYCLQIVDKSDNRSRLIKLNPSSCIIRLKLQMHSLNGLRFGKCVPLLGDIQLYTPTQTMTHSKSLPVSLQVSPTVRRYYFFKDIFAQGDTNQGSYNMARKHMHTLDSAKDW